MRALMVGAFLLWQAASANDPPVARQDAMRYERTLHVPGIAGQACVVLDGQIYPHAAPSLADMRIFPIEPGNIAREIPYAVTLSEAATEETQSARLLKLEYAGGKIAFDLEMPQRAYTDVTLQLDPAIENFLATVNVAGSNMRHGGTETALGSFTLFDLTAQHLSRDTTLPLVESTFRYLHVVMDITNAPGTEAEMAARFAPGMVRGAEVPPSREAQILYTTVAESTSVAPVGRESRATIDLPVRVPVERVSFVLAPGFKGNFSRDVRVTALTEAKNDDGDRRALLPETLTGTILRVHAKEAGREIRIEELSIPAILGANLQSPAKVEVAIENGDDQPLPIVEVLLEMRQREVCFDAAGGDGHLLALFYGDRKLAGPVYDYERLFAASEKALAVQLGPETMNASYRVPEETPSSFAEQHPWILWIALIGVICILGLVAVKTSRKVVR